MSANSEIFETRGNVQTTTQKTSFQEGKRADFALDFPRDFKDFNMRISHPQPLDFESENIEKIDAQKLRFERQKAARRLMPKDRVAKCNWQKIAPYFEMWKSKKNNTGHFRKIFTCGSRAMCPVCAAKITERCKNELVAAFNVGHLHKIHVFMITFTFEHHKAEEFKKVVSDLIESISILRGRRIWRNLESDYEIFGSVTSLETTYGLLNGFHPHKHVLFFSRRELTKEDYEKIQRKVTKEYKKILGELKHTKDGPLKGRLKFNRGLSKTNGVNVRGASQEVLEYVSKYGHEPKKIWGLAAEITKAEQKTGHKTGERFTPFQLLDENNDGDVDMGKAFKEYAGAMRGRAFLTWSNGLRDLFGLGVELTDEEIAALDNDNDRYPFAVGDGVAWNKVREIQIETLEAMRSDFQTFKVFMESKGVNIESGMSEEGDRMILKNIHHKVSQMLDKKPEIKIAPDVLESMQNMDIEKLSEIAKKMMKGKPRVRNIPHDVFEEMMSLDFITFRAAVKALPKLRVESDQKILPDLTLKEIKEILENIETHKSKK